MFSGAHIAPDFKRYGVAVSPMMRTLGFTTLASAMNCRYIPSSSAGTMCASSTMIRSTGPRSQAFFQMLWMPATVTA